MTSITLTGADEQTSTAAMLDLIAIDPRIEIGLLYTASPDGRNRYPSRPWLEMATRAMSGRCALHVCGALELSSWAAISRTSLSTLPGCRSMACCVRTRPALAAARVGTLITQHYSPNLELTSLALGNHAVLIDGSGGRGISPLEWQVPAEAAKPSASPAGSGRTTLPHRRPRSLQSQAPGGQAAGWTWKESCALRRIGSMSTARDAALICSFRSSNTTPQMTTKDGRMTYPITTTSADR